MFIYVLFVLFFHKDDDDEKKNKNNKVEVHVERYKKCMCDSTNVFV